VLAALPVLALAGCGSASADLSVSISKLTKGDPKPGDDVQFQAVVRNQGPGQATGVTVRVDLPTAFRYKATRGEDASGPTTRTQPSDPPVDSANPQWGQWSMGAPGFNADGTPAHAELDITFTVQVDGKPASYPMVPHVFSDSGDEVVGKELAVHLGPASDLALSVAVDEPRAMRGDEVQYHITLINQGSGVASDIGILVTLPDGMIFDKTIHVEGNFTRANPIDPINGALIVYYGGFVLPAASDVRPGQLTLVFSAKVLATAVAGRYTVAAQLTAKDGTVVSLANTAPITLVVPTPSPSPSPSGGATLRAGPTPSRTPTPPSPTPVPTRKKP
jgi:uncharacterized repeat protein (TIGR01451 family)